MNAALATILVFVMGPVLTGLVNQWLINWLVDGKNVLKDKHPRRGLLF